MQTSLPVRIASVLLVLFAGTQVALAQDEEDDTPPVSAHRPGAISNETLKTANDPMAHMKAVNFQDYYMSRLYGRPDMQLNQFLVRYSQPIGKLLLRATMPFVSNAPAEQGPTSGLGDFNLFAIYNFYQKNGTKFGIGPNLTIPTGTHDLGQGKWQAGLSVLAFLAKSPQIQIGSLLQWQTSFAGDENRPDVSLLTPQLFFIWQIGGGLYIRSTGVMSFDLTNGHYNIPVGLGIGKVIPVGKCVFNLFAEPQLSVAAEGAGQAVYQTYFGFNTQF